MNHQIITGDCLEVMRAMPDKSVDLVLCSPPLEDARLYGDLKFNLTGQDWVDWAFVRFVHCARVSRGLVAWVVEGKTKDYRYSATPALLIADLHRAGVSLRKPPIYQRIGIPGSGGPDWLRNDWEFIVCSSDGRLPWSDNSAMGHPPKYAPGGAMSHRLKDGSKKHNPGRRKDGKTEDQTYRPPSKSNPGNVIRCVVGGGRMGSKLAHKNEAPFPSALAEFFVRSFCPPGGTVLDCFAGSGTVASVCEKHNRNSVNIDVRNCDSAGEGLILLRLAELKPSFDEAP